MIGSLDEQIITTNNYNLFKTTGTGFGSVVFVKALQASQSGLSLEHAKIFFSGSVNYALATGLVLRY